MYNSLIYGNGLTISIMKSISKCDEALAKESFIFLNDFIEDLVCNKDGANYRNYFNYFGQNNSKRNNNEYALEYLANNLDEIKYLGFERWISKYLFSDIEEVPDTVKLIACFISNLWHVKLLETYMYTKYSKAIIKEYSEIIRSNLTEDALIFTTNFDTLLDKELSPRHLHGKFCKSLLNLTDIKLVHWSEKKFEYKFLYGTNGEEKRYRLQKIYSNKFKLSNKNLAYYDFDFLFNDDIYFGDLLIYGLAFGKNEFATEAFQKKYSYITIDSMIKSVDGHIIMRLEELAYKKKINSITVSYFSENDLNHYEEIFRECDCRSIIKFIQYNKIFESFT